MLKILYKCLYLFLLNGFLFYLIEHYIWPSALSITPPVTGHLIIGIAFGIINTLLKPLLKILTLPIRWATLGLIGIVINGALIYVLTIVFNQNDIASVSLAINGGFIEYILLGIIFGLGNAILSCRCR